jgi:hypothetical protein
MKQIASGKTNGVATASYFINSFQFKKKPFPKKQTGSITQKK